jgi:hypothetical protein
MSVQGTGRRAARRGSWWRALRRPVVAAVGVVALSATAVAGAQGTGPGFVVTPGAGTQDVTFVVEGAGFPPGAALEEAYVSPEGERFVYLIDGAPAVVPTDAAGRFAVSVLPVRDFVGARAGRWQVWFCAPGGDPCWVAEIAIAA